ncbi:hypothetical protein K7X08_025438 [Anisodus acutangulus]|uniref:Uncharacterized protein n=1 Tax=Anisodus acutangulus TaxID=402998 RepID=A0A9Q1LSN3_9SOLA|nr:hypothetical protein K7X08_025438 [Anisodus acutangulus]
MSLSSAAITYNLVKFHPGFFHFFYAAIDMLSSIAVVESCMMAVACFVPNFTMDLVIGAGLLARAGVTFPIDEGNQCPIITREINQHTDGVQQSDSQQITDDMSLGDPVQLDNQSDAEVLQQGAD